MSIKDRIRNWLKADQMHFDTQGGQSGGQAVIYLVNGNQFLGDGIPRDYASQNRDLSGSSLVMVCVNWFSTTLPEAPLQIIERTADGKEAEIFDHPMTALLTRPNPFYTGALIWAAFALDWFCDGNVYLRKIRNGLGEVIQLWPIPAFSIRPHWPVNDASVFIDYYIYRPGGGVEEKIDPSDVIHFRNGRDPRNTRCGLSPLKSGWREIYGDEKASALSAAVMANHGIVSYAISPKDKGDSFANETEAQAVKAQFQQATTGENAGSAVVNAIPIDITKLAFSPKDLDMAEMRMLPEERIAALLQLPPIVLGFIVGLKNATYSNFAQARRMAYEQMVKPTWNYIADELTHQLLPDFEQPGVKRLAQFDLEKVAALQEDRTVLYTRTAEVYKAGIITRASAKADLGYTVLPDDENIYGTRTGIEQPADPTPTPDQVAKTIEDLERQMKGLA